MMDTKIVKKQDAKLEQSKQTVTPKSSKNNKSLKIVIAIIVVAIIGLVVTFFVFISSATSAPLKASNQLISHIQSKNSNGAYSMFSSATKVDVTLDKVKTVVDQIAPILTGTPQIQSKEISSESDNNAIAKITYKIKGSDGVTYIIKVDLVKENGEWKVKTFDSKQQ